MILPAVTVDWVGNASCSVICRGGIVESDCISLDSNNSQFGPSVVGKG